VVAGPRSGAAAALKVKSESYLQVPDINTKTLATLTASHRQGSGHCRATAPTRHQPGANPAPTGANPAPRANSV